MAELIDRFLKLDSFLVPGKALILYGPRRAGKTTLLKSYLDSCGLRYRLETGDDVRIRNLLGSGDLKQIVAFAEGFELVAIDEAQQIPDIGMGLKILVDHLPALRIIATGSSSFDLAGAIGEPLTGRKRTLTLFPISQMELKRKFNNYDLRQRLEEYPVYGSYPETVMADGRKDRTAGGTGRFLSVERCIGNGSHSLIPHASGSPETDRLSGRERSIPE